MYSVHEFYTVLYTMLKVGSYKKLCHSVQYSREGTHIVITVGCQL